MKIVYFPLFAFLLLSCGSTTSSEPISSSNTVESSDQSSSNDVSSTDQKEKDKETIADFIDYLDDIKGHTKQVNATMTSYYNFSATDDADLVGVDTFTATRYSRNNASDIVVRKGTNSIEGSTSNYEVQTFVSGMYVYQLLDTDGNKTKTYDLDLLDTAENAMNISFAYTQKQNLQYLSSLIGAELIDYEIDLPNEYSINGSISFSYSLTSMESENVKSKQISHEVNMVIEKGVIARATHITQTDLYSGNKRVNWNRVESSFSYVHGDYNEYTGNVFDISEFN